MRSPRLIASAISILLCASALQSPLAYAAPLTPPTVDLNQVEEKVRHLEFQASAAVEAWNESRTKLQRVNRKIANLQIRSRKASSLYQEVSRDFSTVVRSLYKSGTVDIELQALFSEDPARFLQQLDAVSYVGSKQFSTMRKLAAASVNVKTANALLKAQQLKAKRLYERSQQHLKRANQKLREAKAVLAKLKAEERRKYLERQRKKQEQQQKDGKKFSQKTSLKNINRRVAIAVRFALAQLGKRYSRGSTGLSYYDCSGLTKAAYQKAGVYLPHYSRAQIGAARAVSRANLRVGDLVFFFKYGIRHVGLYLGKNRFIHAENSRTGVIISSLSESYYARHLSGFGRVIG